MMMMMIMAGPAVSIDDLHFDYLNAKFEFVVVVVVDNHKAIFFILDLILNFLILEKIPATNQSINRSIFPLSPSPSPK